MYFIHGVGELIAFKNSMLQITKRKSLYKSGFIRTLHKEH
jgi:hypothetical protein